MLLNVVHLKIRIKHVYTVMEGLCIVLQFVAQISHPVHKEFTGFNVKSARVIALTERLALNKTIEDLVHRNLGFKCLIAGSHAKHYIFTHIFI